MLSFSCPTQVHSHLECGKQQVHLSHAVFWVAIHTSATGFPHCSQHPETLVLDVLVSAEVMTPCESKQMHLHPPRGSKSLLSCPLLGTTDLKPHTKPQGRRVQKLCHKSFMLLLPHLFALLVALSGFNLLFSYPLWHTVDQLQLTSQGDPVHPWSLLLPSPDTLLL